MVRHHDPVSLERIALDRIAELRDAGDAADGPIVVVVPTARLRDHLARRLLDARTAWLGVRVETVGGLVGEILAHAGDAPAGDVAAVQLEVLAERALRDDDRDDRWTRYLRTRPRALRRWLAALKDLREAAVEDETLRGVARSRPDGTAPALAEWYAWYVRRLDGLAARGHVDDAWRAIRAARNAPAWAAGIDALLVHGAYDWIGVNIDLFERIATSAHVEWLLPYSDAAPATRTAAAFAREVLAPRGVADAEDGAGALPDTDERPDWAAAFDEARSGIAPSPVAIDRVEAQGARAEVEAAIRIALAEIAAGTPPEEVVVVARGLDAYAPALEAALDGSDVPWSSTHRDRLRRVPWVRDLSLALRIVDEDFPRGPTVEALASRRFDLGRLADGEDRVRPARLEVLSRRAGLIRGLERWEALERDEGPLGIRRLAALRERLGAGAALSWHEHAERLRSLVRDVRVPDDAEDGTVESVDRALDRMAALDGWLDGETVEFAEARRWFDRALDETTFRPYAGAGGLRFVDLLQWRGQTADVVVGLGFHAGGFPAVPREDPILDDDLRGTLRAAGHPLALRRDAALEERQLLIALAGAARRRLVVCRQRADDDGRTRAASTFLRQLERVAGGSPPVVAIGSHPRRELLDAARDPAILSPDDARLLRGLDVDGRADLDAWARDDPTLADGLRALARTESFADPAGVHDARVGPRDLPWLSATAFERLGRCPARYWMRDVLRVRPLDDEPTWAILSPRSVGDAIHALLHAVYGAVDPTSATPAALEAEIDRCWPATFGALVAAVGGPMPALRTWYERRWREAVVAFVSADAHRLADGGWTAVELEADFEHEQALGEYTLRVRGRFDRRLRSSDGDRVSDYKTGASAARGVEPKGMLAGRSLQAPLYRLAAGGATVELLSVSPEADPESPPAEFDGFRKDEHEAGLFETLTVLADLHVRGEFAWREDARVCERCGFASACRRLHPPTRAREERSFVGRRIRALDRKSTRAPLLPRDLAGGARDG